MATDSVLFGRQHAIEELCRAYFVRQLELFGSATGEAFDGERSDLDFLVTFERCAATTHYERYFGFVEALEKLFGRPVGLVEASAMRNPYFVREVNRTKRLVYAA